MIKLQASLTDRGVVDDLQETGGIGHQRAVEQDLVDLQKIHQIDVAFQVEVFCWSCQRTLES
jgi:hypothetical protein